MNTKDNRLLRCMFIINVFFEIFFLVSIVLCVMLAIGTAGFYYFTTPHVQLIDAFHNASMILSGMGPVLAGQLTYVGKIFSSLYAIFS